IQIGPYRLTFRGAAAERPMVETQIVEAAHPVHQVATATLVTPAASPPVTPAGPAPPRQKSVPIGGREAPKPGLIAALARMPKPLLFGGFAVIMAVVIVLGLLFGPSDTSSAGPVKSQATDQSAPTEAADTQKPPAPPAAPTEDAQPSVPPSADSGGASASPVQAGSTASAVIPGDSPPGATVPDTTSAAAPNPADLRAAGAAAASQGPGAPAPASPAPPPPPPVQPKPVQPQPVAPRGGGSTNASSTATTPARSRPNAPAGMNAGRGTKNLEPPIVRRPGESLQAWRGRAAVLQAKYNSASQALAQGEFGAAVSGFDAILQEEPTYLDAPQLYIRAREGQRSAARDAFEAGNKLDAAGDMTGALQKYDMARQIDPSIPGLDDAGKRVREKMRVAGAEAYKRARQYDALGRSAGALQDYEKAAQSLAPDDPDPQAAPHRAAHLHAWLQ